MLILNGKREADLLQISIKQQFLRLSQSSITPGLAVILIGNDPASHIYVNAKYQLAKALNFNSILKVFPADSKESTIIEYINILNINPEVHGILLQLPVPNVLNTESLIQAIDPIKDVDGLHPQNIGLLTNNIPYMIPCTPLACLHLIKKAQSDLRGLKIVLIGASRLIGRPLIPLLLNEGGTVTITHKATRNLPQECNAADIIVAAAGVQEMVKATWVKPGATIIDVGIHQQIIGQHKYIVGDVDFKDVAEHVGAITKVPGGVGPLTVTYLLSNTIKAAAAINKLTLN